MGGEKLKAFQAHWSIFLTVIFLILIYPLPAQDALSTEGDDSAAAMVSAESSIIIGESVAAPASIGEASIFVVLRMVMVLALAALAIYGVVFFIKRLGKPQETRDPHLRLLARLPLSGDTFAAVVSVGPKAWLLAGGSGGLNLVSEIDDTESLETMLLEDARRTAEAEAKRIPDFGSLLRRFGRPSGENPASGNAHVETLRKQRKRLKGL